MLRRHHQRNPVSLCALLFIWLGLTAGASGPLLASDEPQKVAVYILAGQSNMEGHGQLRSLPHLAESKDGAAILKKLREADGKWRTRSDVTVHWPGHNPETGPLGPGWGAGSGEVGPELGFGTVVGDRHEGPVLIIKIAWGGKDVFCDFRSPSAGPPEGDEAALLAKERAKDQRREIGHNYRLMIEHIGSALERIDEIVPGYAGQGFELAGFAWFQGWNDFCRWHERDPESNQSIGAGIISAYSDNLAALIRDLRTALGAPALPVVIGEMSVGGTPIVERAKNTGDGEARAMIAFRSAQKKVASHPGLTGVSFVPTAQYWDDRLEELRQMSEDRKSVV